MDNKQNYLSSYHSEYLLADSGRVHCSETDDRFIAFDWMSEEDFFIANNFGNIVYLLPDYTLSSSIQWKLFYRYYIDFKPECRYLISYLNDSENDARELQTSYEKIIFTIGVVFIIYLITYGFFLSLFAIQNTLYKNSEPGILSLTLNYGWRIFCLIGLYSAKNKAQSFTNIFEYMNGMRCSDESTDTFFTNLFKNINNSSLWDLHFLSSLNTWFIIIDIIVALSIILWKFCNCNFSDGSSHNHRKSSLSSQKDIESFNNNNYGSC